MELLDAPSRLTQAIAAFKAGEMVVVTDDNDRENEGDLVLAAAHTTPENMAFMVRHTSGIVCAPLTRKEAIRLHLDPMVAMNDAPHGTAFTVSVDYRHDTTTGISAAERCATVRALANPNCGATDFVRPGHIFPLIASEGGVLTRSGHTEAAVDLCQLADLPAVGVLAELVNDDGTVMRGAEVRAFAQAHRLKMLSVAELIAYRQRRDTLVERISERTLSTRFGQARVIAYRTPFDTMQHLAVILGQHRSGEAVPVRLHREDVLGDVFGADQAMDKAMTQISQHGCGVMVYLREGSVGVALDAQQTNRSSQTSSSNDETHVSAKIRQEDWREIGLGAQILRDLGITKIRLLASKKRHYVGLNGFGITIAETDIIDP